jgi:predicted phage terminase large subunit-like protein
LKAPGVSSADAARIILERADALSSYEAYCRLAARRRGWRLAPHHKLIVNAIDDVIWRRGPMRLLITAPPGCAKSTYGSQMVPGYFFAHEPLGRMIGGSHTQDLADDFSSMAMNFIRENSIELGYDVGGKFTRQSARAWGTAKGGKYRAIGVGKRIAGERADLVFLDDPVGHTDEVDSLEKRDKLWRWFWTDLRTRLRPGGRIVVMMTRWHEDDIAGRLLKKARPGEWRVLQIAAEAGEDDVLGRRPGEMLWEGTYGFAEELRVIKAEFEANGRMVEWQAVYQGRPTTPGGGIFRVNMIGVDETEPAGYRWVRAWDLAASSNKGDWTVGLKLGIGPDNRLCVGDIVRFRGGPAEVERIMVATAQRDGTGTTISLPQDPGQAGLSQIAYLTRALLGYSVNATRETGEKSVRAMPAAAQVNAGNVSMTRSIGWNAAFVDELSSFPAGTYDDQVDAFSRATSALISALNPTRAVRLSHMER